MKVGKLIVCVFTVTMLCGLVVAQDDIEDYKLLATKRTKTMQKELDQAAAEGYRVKVGAPTSGTEMAVFLQKEKAGDEPFQYKLLATTRTKTMNKELNQAASEGFRLIPSTMVAKDRTFGSPEIVMILEKNPNSRARYEYKLLATTRTKTLQKEVREASEAGYKLVGMVSRDEHMVVMEREVPLN